jgi:hypothetical protein
VSGGDGVPNVTPPAARTEIEAELSVDFILEFLGILALQHLEELGHFPFDVLLEILEGELQRIVSGEALDLDDVAYVRLR